jgi:predicted DNA-binding transcriptional regulator AlpA
MNEEIKKSQSLLTLGELITTKQLADFLQISVSSLEKKRSLHPNAPPPFFKVGRCVRYKTADISKWLDQQQSISNNPSILKENNNG